MYDLISDPEVRSHNVFLPITSTCRVSDFMRFTNIRIDGPCDVVWGPRERWHNDNKYQWSLYASGDNDYAFMQEFITVQGCIGISYVGGGLKLNPNSADHTEFIAVFTHPNKSKWENCFDVPFSVQTDWVHTNFDRFVVLAKTNPNKMLDLVAIAKKDHGYSKLNSKNKGWKDPVVAKKPTNRPFMYWSDAPEDLLCLAQNKTVCINLHSVKRVDGFRQRFFGLFNHEKEHMRKTWIQLPEFWLRKFLKPQCVEDLYTVSASHVVVRVYQTGGLVTAPEYNGCLRDCVLPLIPQTEVKVRDAIMQWLPPPSVKLGLQPLWAYNQLSSEYSYRYSRYVFVPCTMLMTYYTIFVCMHFAGSSQKMCPLL